MSLIDDALKRARERTKTDASPIPPVQKDPWAYAPLPEKKGLRTRTILAIALMAALAAAVGILVLGRGSGGPPSSPSRSGMPAAPTPGETPAPRRLGAASPSQAFETVEVAPPPGSRPPRPSGTPVDRTAEAIERPSTSAIPLGVSHVEDPVITAAPPTVRPAPGQASSTPAQNRPPSGPPQSRPPSVAAGSTRFPAAPPAPAVPPDTTMPVVDMSSASGSPRIARIRAPAAAPVSTPVPVAPANVAAVPDMGSRSPHPDYDAPPPAQAAGPRSALPSVAPRNEVVHSSAANLPAKNYVGSFTTPSGAKIDLGGIVYSETSPVALVNGRVLPTGGMVEGLMVVSIEENRLELEGEGVHVFLSLK